MLTVLFWNLAKNPATIAAVGRLAATHAVDAAFFAECPAALSGPLVHALDGANLGTFREVSGLLCPRVRAFTRLPQAAFSFAIRPAEGDLEVWRVQGFGVPLLLAAVHLPSKAGGWSPADQAEIVHPIAQQLASFEDAVKTRNSVLVGDFNMNPFEPGVVGVTCFNASLTRALAERPDRVFRKQRYRRFYNPMWGLFGDRTAGAAGTHYWHSNAPTNPGWHILDQVLLRPGLIDRLVSLSVPDPDGTDSLLGAGGLPRKEHLSDHLPLVFQLDL